MNIINVGYDSTNYYLIDIHGGKLLVDCGWPGTLPKFQAQLKRKDASPDEITYLLITHFHPDHAGLAQELKQLGVKLLQMENQSKGIEQLTQFFSKKPEYPYIEIKQADNVQLKFVESRSFLTNLGLDGEIIPTPGHSNDSVTLILDEGVAFTGDLPPRFLVSAETDPLSLASWDKIYQHKITRIYPAHGK